MENPIGSGKKSKKMPKDETKKIAKTKEKTKWTRVNLLNPS